MFMIVLLNMKISFLHSDAYFGDKNKRTDIAFIYDKKINVVIELKFNESAENGITQILDKKYYTGF